MSGPPRGTMGQIVGRAVFRGAGGKTFGAYPATRRPVAACGRGKSLLGMGWRRVLRGVGWFGEFFLAESH
jgi:hypothetical protein